MMRSNYSIASLTAIALVVVWMFAGITPGTGIYATGILAGPHVMLDRLLDLYVRDGFVYYAALKSDRESLDRYVASLADESLRFENLSRVEQGAFWINAYNALVLRTVIDHYPIKGTLSTYPLHSIRQIPGAFDERFHRIAGRQLTLDGIEKLALRLLRDPRLSLALGRGAVGSGRLRSEAYTAAQLEFQLNAVVQEFSTMPRGVKLDRFGNTVQVSPIFGWREAEFVAAYNDQGWTNSGRSPLERAILSLIEPALFPSERAFLTENRFTLGYQEFDWRLNDLTGGRP